MRNTMMLLLATSASACLEQAHAQTAPRVDAGARTDARSRIMMPPNPDPHRERAVSAARDTRGALRLLAQTADANVTNDRVASAPLAIGDTIGDSFGEGGLGPAVGTPHASNVASDAGAPIGTVGWGALGRGAGPGSNAGHGQGMGGFTRPINARVLRQTIDTRGTGLPAPFVRRVMVIQQREFTRCFEPPVAASSPTRVSVRAQFEIVRRGDGRPGVTVNSVEGASNAIHACVRTRIGMLLFPTPTSDEPVRVSVTYTLTG